MDLLAWIEAGEKAHPGEHLGGMSMIQEAIGLPGEDSDTARRWDGVARAAAQLHRLRFIDWTYVRPFNEVGETPHDAMDQQYIQRTRDIMIRGEGYAGLRDRRLPAETGTTINITNSIVGQLAFGDISNIDMFVILDAAERGLDELEVPPEVTAEARGVLRRMREAGTAIGTGAVAELLAAAIRRAFNLP